MKRSICITTAFLICSMGLFSSCASSTDSLLNASANAANRTTMLSTTTTVQLKDSLEMPDRIEISACYDGAMDLIIELQDEKTIRFTNGIDEVKTCELTKEQIAELNQLYYSITDFSALPFVEEGYSDTTIYRNNEIIHCSSIYTTQKELEQYLTLLKCYYRGIEYDWSVEQVEGYIR